jgi:hypothetical protein
MLTLRVSAASRSMTKSNVVGCSTGRLSTTLFDSAAPHCITSVAWISTDCGSSSPSALAIFKLMMKSNFVAGRPA